MGLVEETRVRIDALELVDKIRSCGARITQPDKWQQARKELAAEIEAVAAKDAELAKVRNEEGQTNWIRLSDYNRDLAAADQRWQERVARVEADTNKTYTKSILAWSKQALQAQSEAVASAYEEAAGMADDCYEMELGHQIRQLAAKPQDANKPYEKPELTDGRQAVLGLLKKLGIEMVMCDRPECTLCHPVLDSDGKKVFGTDGELMTEARAAERYQCVKYADDPYKCPTFPECKCGSTEPELNELGSFKIHAVSKGVFEALEKAFAGDQEPPKTAAPGRRVHLMWEFSDGVFSVPVVMGQGRWPTFVIDVAGWLE